mgnify:CR=1 FL=1
MPTLSDFKANRLAGGEVSLSDYAGKVALVVNVASQCGKTPQYEGLEALYERYGPDNFVVLGFPCNQFGEQEPGSDAEIADFCTTNFGVKFPMFSKIEVNGPKSDPLYQWLKSATPDSGNADIEWNFAKFLIGKDGQPVRRISPDTEPADIADDIASLL